MISVANEKVARPENESRGPRVADGPQNICPLDILRVTAHEEQLVWQVMS